MDFWSTIWDAIWWFVTAFVFIAYLMALFTIIIDLFRDRKLNGFAKALWFIFLIFLPFLTTVVYLIVRGRGIGERASAQQEESRKAAEGYIRSVSATGAAEEIATAKSLLDSGTITAAEFEKIKARALA